MSPDGFREHIRSLAEREVPVVPLRKIHETSGAVALTFDDGYRNFLDHGLPFLQQHRMPATLFVVSGCLGGSEEWSRTSPLKVSSQRLLDWHEIAALPADLIEIGAHTASHSDLSTLSAKQVTQEMYECRAQLEDRVGRPVESLAYPYGSSTPEVRRAAAKLFRLACGTRLDYVTLTSDRMNMPRIDAFYLRDNFWFDQLMGPAGRGYITVRRLLRRARVRLGSASSRE